jgi:hypothetical protein
MVSFPESLRPRCRLAWGFSIDRARTFWKIESIESSMFSRDIPAADLAELLSYNIPGLRRTCRAS